MRKNRPRTPGRSPRSRVPLRSVSTKSGLTGCRYGPLIGDPMNTRTLIQSGSVAAAAFSFMLLAMPAAAQTRHIEKRFIVDSKPVVILRNPSGKIHLKASDRHEIVVSAQYTGARTVIDTEQVANRVEVVTSSPGSSADDARVDLDLTVPVESELQVRTDSGSVTVES